MSHPAPPPSKVRRLVVALAVVVPLLVDPFGDTLALKKLALGLLGTTALALEALEVLALGRRAMRPNLAEWLLAGLGLWGACSLSWAANPALGLVGVGLTVGMLGVARGVRQSLIRRRTVGTWIVAMLAVGLLAMLVDGVAIVRHGDELQLSTRKYASWLFEHNNMAANYAAVLAPLAAALALAAGGWRGRAGGWSLVAGVLAYQLLLRSRAGLAATLLGVVVVVLIHALRRRIPRPGRRAAVVMALLCGATALLPSSDRARGLAKEAFYYGVGLLEELQIGDLADASFRPGIYRRTMQLVAESPLRGVGVGNFPVRYARFDPRVVEIPHAHNDALQVLAETGLLGLLLFLGLLCAIAWQVLVGLASRDRESTAVWAVGLGGALLVFVMGGLFEVPFALGDTACNVALLAALSARLAADSRCWPRPRAARPLALLLLLAALVGLTLLARRLPASSLYHHARLAEQAGDLPEARRLLTELTELDTGMDLPLVELGRLAETAGDWQAALEHFEAGRRLWPHSLKLLELEATALMQLGQSDAAVARCEEAVALTPTDRATQARLILFLAQAGRVQEAIARATYLLQSRPADSIEIVASLARLQLRASQEQTGPAWVTALVASRHFYAVLLEHGDAALLGEWNREFRHLTHQLQSLPGAPDVWWAAYEGFLAAGGWELPSAALWTAVDGEGEALFPGWAEAAGPPLPLSFR